MRNKNGGFIATSLIYSFFLVFVAIVAALLNNYIANKTILDRFNANASENLNTGKHTVSVYATNANIVDGMTLTNLISNPDFTSRNTYWQEYPNYNYYTYISNYLGKYSAYKSWGTTYLYQNVYLVYGSQYYVAYKYARSTNSNMRTCLGSSCIYNSTSNSGAWIKNSMTYRATSTGAQKFYMGYSPSSASAYLTDAMVVNLTASFGSGYEPASAWLDENLDFFSGTISYIRKDLVNSGETVTIRLAPYANYTRYSLTCINPATNSSVYGASVTTRTERINGSNITFKDLSIRVSSDVKCTWRGY